MLTRVMKSDCGCEFEISPAGQVFNWCPLHKSARDMYEVLKLILSLGLNDGRRWMVEQALAKAEGK